MTDLVDLLANYCVDAARMPLATRMLAAAQTIAGHPSVGTAELGRLGDVTIGVWELTPSVSTDVEVDEFFVVLSGAASVHFADGSPSLQLRAGSVGRLAAGSSTTWHVTETLRKIYIA
jgi:uncharacterized cupin superfamily protein